MPDGKVTSYKGAVKTTGDEKIVCSWVKWPDKKTRVAGWKKIMDDPQHGAYMPLDGKRMIYGGFSPPLDA